MKYNMYSVVDDDDVHSTSSLESYELRPQRSNERKHTYIHILINAVLALAVVILFLWIYHLKGSPSCISQWSTYCTKIPLVPILCSRLLLTSKAPILSHVPAQPQTWKFNGTFSHPSPYKGPPNASVDDAWDRLYNCTFISCYAVCSTDALRFSLVNLFRISPDDLARIGGRPTAAKFPPELGGGYLGFVEVLHQLHCVVCKRFSQPVFSLHLDLNTPAVLCRRSVAKL